MPPSNLLLAAKVVVNEEPPQIRNIPGVATAVAAFAGVTERGPVRTPTYVTTFEEFVEIFGSYTTLSDLPLAIEGYFRNGGTGCWISRVVHYTDITDPLTSTAAKGSLTLNDRGGAAAAAVLDGVAGPYQLEPSEQLDLNIDGAGTDSLVLAAAPPAVVSGNSEPFALSDGDTLVYRTNENLKSTTLGPLRTISFLTADFVAIGAATAEEVANVIARDGIGISAEVTGAGTTVTIRSDAKGTGATINIDASSTAIAVGKLNIASGSTNGTGNVSLIDAVTASELAALLTALPLSSGTATTTTTTTTDDTLRITSTGTGVAATVVVEATTTALGIFTGSLPITETGTDAAVNTTATITAKYEGEWIATPVAYVVSIEAASSGDTDRFNFRLKKGTSTVENWPDLSMDSTDDRYAEDFINANSKYVEFTDESSPATPPANLPEVAESSSWAGQDNGLTSLADADYTGSQAGGTGLYAFDEVDFITILAVPGRATSAVHNAMLTYCETERALQCFAVLDPPSGLDEQGIKTYVETTASLKNLSEFGAIYWPLVKILNPSSSIYGTTEDDQITVPPSGHVVGTYTRVDANFLGGVYQAPAGVDGNRGVLYGVLGFETDDVLDERKRDVVYPARINPITKIGSSPIHIDGSRTLKGDSNFPSVPERRGVIFIEQSLKQGLLFAKHRNNDRRLRMEVKRSIDTFLLRQYDVGAFRGDTPSESFFTDVSDALNPIEVIFAGELHARIGLATQKPAEFIVLIFTQDTRELEERLASQSLG